MEIPTWAIFLCIILASAFSVLGAIGLFQKQSSTAKQNQDAIINSLESKNEELSTSLDSTRTELIAKQAELKAEQSKIYSFTKDIDANTKAISVLADEISKVTSKTNVVTRIIENEQRQKGFLKLKKPTSETFKIVYGKNVILEHPLSQLENGLPFSNPLVFASLDLQSNINISVRLSDDDLLISGSLHEKNGKRVIELKDGEWALSKGTVFSINYDGSAIEIIDNDGYVLFQMEVMVDELRLKGIFYGKKAAFIINDGIQSVSYDSDEYEVVLKSKASKIERIFKHTGENYLNTRDPEIEKARKIRREIIKQELLQNYDHLSNLLLIEKTSQFVNKYSLLSENTRNEMIELIKQQNIAQADIVHEKIIHEYETSIRAEAIKLRNTLLQRIPQDILDKNPTSMTLDNYKNPNGNPEIGGVIKDIDIMLQLLKKE
ncbi:hypothetical protein [uncultured Winogradskyella sp.]|uniref:hypothetical protein n=1 Tax=uncultured Winogradskyella sp. TaxID=395353 RepID=UPI0026323EA4|nr:hypothetical protein [uncultured Winogradskyella sp.]